MPRSAAAVRASAPWSANALRESPRRLPIPDVRRGRRVDERDDAAHVRAPEPEDLVRICRALNEAGDRYVLIGGFAVVAHGGGRFTKDIDFLIDDDPGNVARVTAALGVLADNSAGRESSGTDPDQGYVSPSGCDGQTFSGGSATHARLRDLTVFTPARA